MSYSVTVKDEASPKLKRLEPKVGADETANDQAKGREHSERPA